MIWNYCITDQTVVIGISIRNVMENGILDTLKVIRNSLEFFQKPASTPLPNILPAIDCIYPLPLLWKYWRKKLDANICISFLILR
jgi:hypothetical protein